MTRPRTRFGLTAAILESGLMPNFATDDIEVARGIAQACADGGCSLLEFLNRGVGAPAAFGALAPWMREHTPNVLLGAGTVLDGPTAAQFIHAGAAFIVAPNLNPDVAKVCNRLAIPYIPGCGTATEISNAMEMGVDIVKFFPAPFLGGPAAVKALLGPFPQAMFMPSGGVEVDEASLRAWFGAGVAAVSVGGSLLAPDLIAARDWPALADRIRKAVDLVATIRSDWRRGL